MRRRGSTSRRGAGGRPRSRRTGAGGRRWYSPAGRWPQAAAVAGVVLGLLAGGFLWLRDSSLVAVREVVITGFDGPSAPAIRSALRATAADMTTLHIREGELRAAVAAFPAVRDVQASPAGQHRLRIRVVGHEPVAAVAIGGSRIPVAADGALLRGQRAAEELPLLKAGRVPAGGRLTERPALDALAVIGAAPPELRPLIEAVERDRGGLHVQLQLGPRLDFGGPGALRPKWAAAARVLADPRSAGAAYLDLRVPRRPVAGPFAPQPDGDEDGGAAGAEGEDGQVAAAAAEGEEGLAAPADE